MNKIAVVRSSVTELNPDSYNIQEIGLAKALLKSKGISVDVFLFGEMANEKVLLDTDEGMVRVITYEAIKLPGQQGIAKGLKHKLIQGNYDLIQVHEYHFLISIYIAWVYRLQRMPVVLCQGLNQDSFGKLPMMLQKIYDKLIWSWFKKYFSGACAKTDEAKNYLELKQIELPINITPIGLDIEKFKSKNKIDWRNRLNIGKEKKIILNISNITFNKNVMFLLKVFDELAKNQDAILLWVGKVVNEKYFLECKKLIEKLNIKDKVYFLGVFPQEDIPSLYKSSDIFIHATNTGIYGMVFLEAMYFGLPIITNQSAGSEQIIHDGVSGFTLSLEDQNNWVDIINKLLEDNELYESISLNAKKRINNYLIWDEAVKNFYEFYFRLYNKHSVSSKLMS